MSRLATIEDRLVKINETIFQELCDSYLSRVNKNYIAFSRTGSQSGKQKTIKGKPDSFFLLPSGNYIFVEHTTKSTNRKSKLVSDINDCLNLAKDLNIPIEKVEEIILCTNFNLDVDEVNDLIKILEDTSIKLTLKTLDSLSIDIFFHHQDLANRYLDLPLDTGQVVSIKQFIQEYNRASQGIATPLDNEFLHRADEKQKMLDMLKNSDVLILSGKAGVGKTKLAINGIEKFLSDDVSFNAFCISYKGHTLLPDLFQYLKKDRDYILFVDDANRIDAFTEIMGFFKAERTGRLKIIITVRDYALMTIENMCRELNYDIIFLEKFTDDQINDLIESDSFNIKNSDFQKEIKRIADGNPRIAIMAALLAIDKQDIRSLSDVSALFEKYFSTFVKDEGEFANKENIKFLGIISFFNKIAYKKREIVEPILTVFNLEYHDFIESIDKLGNLELIEIKFDHVSVSEQNLSMFFFYKAFVKEEHLSFKLLLKKFHKKSSSRLKECVIHSNNTFGQEKVMDKLKPELESYWKSIETGQREEKLKFLKTFWYYLQDQTLEFIYNESQKEIFSETSLTHSELETSEIFVPDEIVGLLGNLFITENYNKALNLSFRIIKNHSIKAQQVVDEMINKFKFSRNDQYTDFNRQISLVNSWLEKIDSNEQLFAPHFYALSKNFLHFEFEHTEPERNSVIFYKYPIPLTSSIKNIRLKIWNFIKSNFDKYPEKSFSALDNYRSGILRESSHKIIQFDLQYLLDIIESKLSIDSIEHCDYVHKLNKWCPINSPELNTIQNKFTNNSYELYLYLNIEDQFMTNVNMKMSFDEFSKIRSEEIRAEFIFKSLDHFKEFYLNYKKVTDWKNSFTINALDLILDENFKRNEEIGIKILIFIIEKNNEINYIPNQLFSNNFKSILIEKRVWKLINKYEFNYKVRWMINFFSFMSHIELKNEYRFTYLLRKVGLLNEFKISINDYLDLFQRIENSTSLFLEMHQKYFVSYPKLPHSILKIITKKNDQGIKITLRPDFFIDNIISLQKKYPLLSKAYLTQLKLNKHFDFHGKVLRELVKINGDFLLIYVKTQYSFKKYGHPEPTMYLSNVWEIDGIDDHLEDVFNWIINNAKDLGFNKQYCNVFFKNLDDHQTPKAKQFIKDFIEKYNQDPSHMNLILNIIRNSLPDFFEYTFIHYLNLNQDKNIFSKISWLDNEGSVTGNNVYIGEIKAGEWEDLLHTIEKSNLGISVLPIQNYIKERISAQIKFAEQERKFEYLRGF